MSNPVKKYDREVIGWLPAGDKPLGLSRYLAAGRSTHSVAIASMKAVRYVLIRPVTICGEDAFGRHHESLYCFASGQMGHSELPPISWTPSEGTAIASNCTGPALHNV